MSTHEPTGIVIDFTALTLDTLEFTGDEFISIGHDADGVFRTVVLPPADAPGYVDRLPDTANIFFGVNPTKGPARENAGRGTEADVTRLSALWCDLDVKPGSCKDFDTAHTIVGDLSAILGTRTSVIVHSGHGLHAYWPVSDGQISGGDIGSARALLRRWRRLVALVAAQHHARVDAVYDLPRMLRLPGSLNNKGSNNGQAAPPVIAHADIGGPLTIDEINERLTEVGIHEEDGDAACNSAEEVSPPSDWKWADTTCDYATKIIDGLATDGPKKGGGRHPWLLKQAVRLACAHRLGCITESDYLRAQQILARRFTELLNTREPRREPQRFEIAGAWKYGVARAATKTDEETRKELGGHQHRTKDGVDSAPPADPSAAEPRGRGVALTDKGNALALADAYADHLRYIPEMGKWIRWTGMYWHIDADTGAIDTAAGQIAMSLPTSTKAAATHKKRSLSSGGITGMVRLARSDPEMRVAQKKLDANGYELNTPTGIVDLRTGKFGEHRANAWHTKVTGVAYDPDADCPLWKAFLLTTFGNNEELIDYIQNLSGYAAIGEVFHHILPFFFGTGQNGKTVLLKVLTQVLGGGYAITAPANFLLAGRDKHETEIARLAGTRFVVCSEINQGAKFDEAKVKLLTGGDDLTGRAMYQNFSDFRPSHTLFLMGNHQPAVGAGGDAFWRRVRLIPFEHRVPDELVNEYLADELVAKEGPAILAWIVRGAVTVATGKLIEPETVTTATEDYAESEDHISQFINECVTKVTDGFKLPSGQVYRRYVSWCQENGIPPKASSVFGRDMSARGFRTAKSDGKRFMRGIMLDTPVAADPRNPE